MNTLSLIKYVWLRIKKHKALLATIIFFIFVLTIVYFIFMFKVWANEGYQNLNFAYLWALFITQFILMGFLPMFLWKIRKDFYLKQLLLLKSSFKANLILLTPFLVVSFIFNLFFYFLTLIITSNQHNVLFHNITVNWGGIIINSNIYLITTAFSGLIAYFIISKIKNKHLAGFIIFLINLLFFVFSIIPKYYAGLLGGDGDNSSFSGFLYFVQAINYVMPNSYSFNLIFFNSVFSQWIVPNTVINDPSYPAASNFYDYREAIQILGYSLEIVYFFLFFLIITTKHFYWKNFSFAWKNKLDKNIPRPK